MRSPRDNSRRWYWAAVVMKTVQKAKARQPRAMAEVWENLVLIRARNAAEAIKRADKIGEEGAGDSSRAS